jgi:hypothetical protein
MPPDPLIEAENSSLGGFPSPRSGRSRECEFEKAPKRS